jgi:hypothetical protein
VETALRCQKCGTPICPRCMVQSPVGARCPDCAKVVKSPIYTLNRAQYARAAVASLVGGAVMGVVWALVLLPFSFGFFGAILVGVALGWVFTKLLNFATGNRRGNAVVVFASAGILIAWGIMAAAVGLGVALPALIAVAIGVYFAYQNLSRL